MPSDESGAPALVDLDGDADWDLVVGSCVDIATTVGRYNLDCTYFDTHPSYCGYYDDDDFTSSELCCACGGGDHNTFLVVLHSLVNQRKQRDV